MNIEFTKKFEDQIDGLRDEKLKNEIADVVNAVMIGSSLHDIPHIQKLSGYKTHSVSVRAITG